MRGEHCAPHGKGQGSAQHQLVMSKYHREVKMEPRVSRSPFVDMWGKSIVHVWKQDIFGSLRSSRSKNVRSFVRPYVQFKVV